MSTNGTLSAPAQAVSAVLFDPGNTSLDPTTETIVRGFDFNDVDPKKGIDLQTFLNSFATTGFQATNLSKAIDIINEMIDWDLSKEPIAPEEDDDLRTQESREKVRCKIFLAYTSNMISSGVREIIRFLVQHKMVSVLVTTAGGIEEDFIKCMSPTFMGDFTLSGETLRKKGINRIGNLLIPNKNYVDFEKWIMPILDKMVEEQKTQGTIWSPSKIIHRLGKEINHPDSVYYWAYKNDIPVFCPGLTDGSLGDMIYFHSYQNPGLIVDIASDIRQLNNEAAFARRSGMVILGGGIVKHHVCNANMMRNGADYAVFINTAQEFDGSDSGARPDEAVSWGKIKIDGKSVKVHGDATIIFPLVVASSFALRRRNKN